MARIIIARATLKRELNMAMDRIGCSDPVIWLEAGDHNQPRKRREAIVKALESCAQYDTVILAMSFCGNSLVGLKSGAKSLLLPCFDDCIGLLLGETRRKDAYYLTDGWLQGQRNIFAEYESALRKYGQEKAERIFAAMLRGYSSLAWIDTGAGTEEGKRKAMRIAALLGLTFEVVPGCLKNLEALLAERDAGHILRLPPHSTITPEMRRGMIPVTLSPERKVLYALPGENLLTLLRRNGLAPDAPCGGRGTCGKCIVYIDNVPQKACGIAVTAPLSLRLGKKQKLKILSEDAKPSDAISHPAAAVDIGTTSLVCSLLEVETGARLAVTAGSNPQNVYGADVVTRIQAALSGSMETQTELVRKAVSCLIQDCCAEIHIKPESVERICIAGNPAMEQLFLGISLQNLAEIPFAQVLTETKHLDCRDYLPLFPNASLLIAPNISGYIGGDTVGCILSEKLYDATEMTLLVDIGTNGEMVLAGGNRMVACATAAGPALEGANIRFGMRACDGAIDHVWLENGEIRFSTIGNVSPEGICGSGLIDAVAVFLELGAINSRGRIAPEFEKDGQRILTLCESIWLTQEDIRQVQLAKGAICAGIRLMMRHLDISEEDIGACLLAGAFGTYLNPESACRIGLIPGKLQEKIRSVGNAALRGAEQMLKDHQITAEICRNTEVLELASLGDFPRTYAKSMNF